MKNSAIIGYSGHAFVVLDACKKANITINAYCDRFSNDKNIYELDYLGNETDDKFNWNNVDAFVLGIGDNNIRNKIAELIKINNLSILSVVHPTAVINDFVKLGEGIFVASNAVVNPLATIEDFCIINTGAIIEHECIIGKASHIAPGAVLAGNVKIGEKTFIGANSVVKQGVIIGNNVTVGAGSVVLKNIPDGETWAGNPAKKIK